jgi:hypothetical protein
MNAAQADTAQLLPPFRCKSHKISYVKLCAFPRDSAVFVDDAAESDYVK